jgi:acetyltransferase-like isoleucine patch superfamily enzyme
MDSNIGNNTKIKCIKKHIPDTAIIGDNVNIECEELVLGEFTKIGNNVNIKCRKFIADDWLYMCEGVEIGRGGCTGPKSNIFIGKNVGIFENTIINPSDTVKIGDNVGIGAEVMIWTHGAWLDITKGFPSDFGPVEIGNNVWLPARSIVLPNVSIGDDCVIGINSIVNKDIPSGSLAAGSPCKVIKYNHYPKEINSKELLTMVNSILGDWVTIILAKIDLDEMSVVYDNNIITLKQKDGETQFDVIEKTMKGFDNDVSQDLRDYLRRRGIKIYTDKLFKSI